MLLRPIFCKSFLYGIFLTFAFKSLMMKRTSIWVLVLEGLHRLFNFSFFSIIGQGIDLDYCDIEWFALEMKRDHSALFEIASKYCILDSFVDSFGEMAAPFLLSDSCPQ